MVTDPREPIPSVLSGSVLEGSGKRSGLPLGLVVAAIVESVWLLFLGWMAVRGT